MSLHSAQAQSGPDPSRSVDNDIAASPAVSVPSRADTANVNLTTGRQQFVCTVGITVEKCRQEMSVLRKVLAKYPSSELGQWRWVLVHSDQWRLLLIGRGFNSGVPALTALDAKTTFFEEALIAGSSDRVSNLMEVWHADRDGLLDLAVRHELGHALCGEENEQRADRVAGLLERKQPVTCKGGPKSRSVSAVH
jgi:hypothetical protein